MLASFYVFEYTRVSRSVLGGCLTRSEWAKQPQLLSRAELRRVVIVVENPTRGFLSLIASDLTLSQKDVGTYSLFCKYQDSLGIITKIFVNGLISQVKNFQCFMMICLIWRLIIHLLMRWSSTKNVTNLVTSNLSYLDFLLASDIWKAPTLPKTSVVLISLK